MIDLTHTDTIYKRKLRTISLKIDQRFTKACSEPRNCLQGPEDVYAVLRSIFEKLDDDQEHFILLAMSQANTIIGYKVLFTGAQNSSVVDSKVIFRNALLLGARNIIVAHNHPSGNAEPSDEDRIITRRIAQTGSLHDISLLDHIIYTHNGYTSIRDDSPSLFYRIGDGSQVHELDRTDYRAVREPRPERRKVKGTGQQRSIIQAKGRKVDLSRAPYRGIFSEVAREKGISRQAVQQALRIGNPNILARIAEKVEERTRQNKGKRGSK